MTLDCRNDGQTVQIALSRDGATFLPDSTLILPAEEIGFVLLHEYNEEAPDGGILLVIMYGTPDGVEPLLRLHSERQDSRLPDEYVPEELRDQIRRMNQGAEIHEVVKPSAPVE